MGRAEVRDEVGEPGTGPVCFGSFAFADEPGDSVLVVPRVIIGRRGDRAWLTTIGPTTPSTTMTGPDLPSSPAVADVVPPANVSFADGALNGEEWLAAVADAIGRIEAGARSRRSCSPAT